ncbi:MAG: ketol-acid reductoisomerase, partial [Planctomycetes bacterium]|nr:ketol-acid reductoisomerase [Planctomycetota bacterium]
LFKELYKRVKDGEETRRVIRICGKKDYQQALARELADLGESEMWRAGRAVRSLRPKEKAKAVTAETKGVSGRKY